MVVCWLCVCLCSHNVFVLDLCSVQVFSCCFLNLFLFVSHVVYDVLMFVFASSREAN